MLSPPTQLWTEVQRPQDNYRTEISSKLTSIVAKHCNTYNKEYTTEKHICVGVHRTSILFMLHLAVNTFNECSSESQPKLMFKSIDEEYLCADDSFEIRNMKHTIYVLSTKCPLTQNDFQLLTQHNQHIVLVFDIPNVLTENKWSCAFAVFPNLQHSESQTEFTSVRRVFGELQKELGTIPSSNIQSSALLTFTPWIQSFVWKYNSLVKWIATFIISQCQKKNISLKEYQNKQVDNAYSFQYHCVCKTEQERIIYLTQECSSVWIAHVKEDFVLFHFPFKYIRCEDSNKHWRLMKALPEKAHDTWAPTDHFFEDIGNSYPEILKSIDVLKEILNEE